MKLKNRVTTIEKDKETFFSYGDLIKILLNTPAKKGYTYLEMGAVIKLTEQLDKKEFTFDKQSISIVQEIISNFKWGFIHKDIIEFCETIMSLKDDTTSK
jgi:hypothetical protein